MPLWQVLSGELEHNTPKSLITPKKKKKKLYACVLMWLYRDKRPIENFQQALLSDVRTLTEHLSTNVLTFSGMSC